jgi:hypothetical protein
VEGITYGYYLLMGAAIVAVGIVIYLQAKRWKIKK